MLAGLGLIGCTPAVMHSHGTNGSCVEEQNAAISDYNNKLKALVDQFNDRFSANSKFILIPNESNAIDIAHGNKFGFLILQSTSLRDAYNIVFFISKYELLVFYLILYITIYNSVWTKRVFSFGMVSAFTACTQELVLVFSC